MSHDEEKIQLKKGIEALKKKEALTISFSKEELEWAKGWSNDKWDDFKRFVDNSDSIYEGINHLLTQLKDDFIDEKKREEEEE